MSYTEKEEQQMLDKAQILLERGGLSGTTIDFIENLLWHGFSRQAESAYFEYKKLREILQLHEGETQSRL